MPLAHFLKKASSIILGIHEEISAPPFANGEVVFCKNNVCVHPPTLLRQDCDIVHHPGYLSVTCHQESDRPTLRLTWIPNTTLRKNPWTLEKQSIDESSGPVSLSSIDSQKFDIDSESNRSFRPGYIRQNSVESTESRCSGCGTNSQISVSTSSQSSNNPCSQFCSVSTIKPSNSSDMASCLATAQGTEPDGQTTEDCSSIGTNSSSQLAESCDINAENLNISLVNSNSRDEGHESRESSEEKDNDAEQVTPKFISGRDNHEIERFFSVEMIPDDSVSTPQMIYSEETINECTGPIISIEDGPIISIEDSREDVKPYTPDLLTRSPSLSSACSLSVVTTCSGSNGEEIPAWMSSPEMLALQHNLMFPESATASPVVRRAHRCRKFSVDLSQMRSLRLFFNDTACTCGQLVVASRESQYKILHFHHGGLDHLANVLQEWNFLLHSTEPSHDDALPYRHFMVCRPEVSQEELHPEEGQIPPVNYELWMTLLNEEGQLEDDLSLRKCIFFGGLEREMRLTVWPFLLHLYSFQSTFSEREQIQTIRKQEYHEITRRRLELDPEKQENFWKNVQCVVEKDVIRTDRGNPYFAGENNPNIEIMKNILLNYAVYNPGSGYTQGMSDLLAPVLAEIKDESEAFWCFVGLMQKAIFVCTPRDNDMDRNLNYLRELIRLMVPDFYEHLQQHKDATELLFCHRWILLCFKREFPEAVALRMWESCWANYLTDYFHLFLCLAIICIYSEDVIAQDLRTDEMLLHFSSLAMYMDGELILRKARGLVHQFRQIPRIPCTLAGLCQLCGPGIWDSTHAPVVECTGKHASYELCSHRDLQQISG